MHFSLQKPLTIQVGISLSLANPNLWETVWFVDRKPHFLNFSQGDIDTLKAQIQQMTKKPVSFCWITAVLPHQLLRKTLIFSQTTTRDDIERQCLQHLEKLSPVPLEDLWFDYMKQSLEEGTIRIDLFAIVKSVGKQVVAQFQPLHIHVLDAVMNTLEAAFLYVLEKKNLSPDALYLYQQGSETFALCVKKEESLILHQKSSLRDIKQSFCDQFNFNPNNTYVFCHEKGEGFEKLGEVVEVDMPLIPLGCALWQGSREQVIGG